MLRGRMTDRYAHVRKKEIEANWRKRKDEFKWMVKSMNHPSFKKRSIIHKNKDCS